jgi:translation initiation factor eIF-2B subunit alpha
MKVWHMNAVLFRNHPHAVLTLVARPAVAAAGLPISSSGQDLVVSEFHSALARSSDMAVAVAAIQALTMVIRCSKATTIMGLGKEVQAAAAALQRCNPTAISLQAGCELFLRYITRTSAVESADFDEAKQRLIERGRHFAETSKRARATIAEQGEKFIRPGFTVLCHGHSRVALSVLRKAASAGRNFSVILTEGRPDDTGPTMARVLDELRIPVTVVLDSGVGYVMER